MTARGVWRSATRAWNSIPLREPWRVLVPLLVFHWIALVVYTTKVNHNAWLFYQGGDQIWYWTTSWLIGHGWLNVPEVSQGWSMLLVPLAWLGGPGFLGGLPLAMLLQIVVFTPLALWCVYELASRVGGRYIGYLGAAVWTIGPYIAIPLFVHRYHDRYVDQFLPLPFGLTAMADYPTTVCLLASAALAVRAVDNRDPPTAALSGLTLGFAVLVKPSSIIYALAPVLMFLLARRWRELAIGAIGVVPALIALTIWKYRGYGDIPAFAYQETRVALGGDTIMAPYRKYVDINWHNIAVNLDSLREFFWSVRVLQWVPFAGAIAVARRSLPLAVFFSAWFWAFFVLKGSAEQATVDSGTFFRLLIPAMPAFFILAVAVPLLVPVYGAALARRTRRGPPRPIGWRPVVPVAIVLGIAPIVAAAAATPLQGPEHVLQVDSIAVPVDGGFDFTATARGEAVRLSWEEPPARGTRLFYKIFRSPAGTDYSCEMRNPGSDLCVSSSETVDIVRRTSAVDRPEPGRWTYRIGTAANWVDDPQGGDVFLLSKPVTVTVP